MNFFMTESIMEQVLKNIIFKTEHALAKMENTGDNNTGDDETGDSNEEKTSDSTTLESVSSSSGSRDNGILDNLPYDIVSSILGDLDPKSVMSLTEVNKKYNGFVKSFIKHDTATLTPITITLGKTEARDENDYYTSYKRNISLLMQYEYPMSIQLYTGVCYILEIKTHVFFPPLLTNKNKEPISLSKLTSLTERAMVRNIDIFIGCSPHQLIMNPLKPKLKKYATVRLAYFLSIGFPADKVRKIVTGYRYSQITKYFNFGRFSRLQSIHIKDHDAITGATKLPSIFNTGRVIRPIPHNNLLNLGLIIPEHINNIVLSNCLVEDISVFRHAREVSLLNCPNIKDLSPLRNAEKIVLTDHAWPSVARCKKFSKFPDLSCLNNVKELEISLEDGEEEERYIDLTGMVNLEKFDFHSSTGETFYRFNGLSKSPKLNSLQLKCICKLDDNFIGSNIESLGLVASNKNGEYHSSENNIDISNMVNIRNLSLCDFKKFDGRCLDKLTKLDTLRLENCKTLINIPQASKLIIDTDAEWWGRW